MNYVISKKCNSAISSFYHNVAKKYKHTYSKETMRKNIHDAYQSIFKIENGLLRRSPTLSRWNGYHMANTDKWYYAYRIEGDTIYVEDACHAQNMHEAIVRSELKPVFNLMERLERVK